MIRQPIISVLGHVDSGKTTFLDFVRGSLIAAKEPGRITQSIGATEVPLDTIQKVCGDLITKFGLKLTIPGLLFIDTPGHAAFISLRRRGSVLSDIAVLILDQKTGVQEQTKEVINILRDTKTPFIIALNKIDQMPGWEPKEHYFLNNYNQQSQQVKQDLDNKLYELMRDFSHYNIDVDRFDRVEDYTKKAGIVPISSKTGEGIPELLMVLSGLSQQYLKNRLEVKEEFGRATVLEINELKGFGPSLDIILYDGVIRKKDKIVFRAEGKNRVSDIKAILKAEPLKDLKEEKKFKPVLEIYPACGAKLVLKNCDGIQAGSTIISIPDIERLSEITEEFEDIVNQIPLSEKGVVIKANSIGGLEALARIFQENNILVKRAEVGLITKKDIIDAENGDREYQLVFGFNTSMTDSAKVLKEQKKVQVFTSKVIYQLIDRYIAWRDLVEKEKINQILDSISRPAKLILLPEHVFRNSNPVVIGVEIGGGILKADSSVINLKGNVIGKVQAIQKDNESVKSAVKGDEVAVSIKGAVLGRNLQSNEILYVNIKSKDYKLLQEYKKYLSDDELNVLEEIVEIKNRTDPRWKFK